MKLAIKAVLCLSFSASIACAGEYPSKPIQILVPYGAGGAADVVSRIFADHMAKTLARPVVVLNKPGGNANIAPAAVATAEPDGYTLLSSSVAFSVNPFIETNLGWKAEDFTPLAKLVESSNLFVVPSSIGVTSLGQFVEYAKRTEHLPTNVSSLGNSQALSREHFAQAAGIRFTGIGYKGGVTWLADLANGSLVFSVAPINPVVPLIESGKLRVLASTGTSRATAFPNVPTVTELGYPEATSASWFGFHVPAGTPQDVIDKLDKAVKAASEDPSVTERIEAAGATISYLGPEQFANFMNRELERAKAFATIVKSNERVSAQN